MAVAVVEGCTVVVVSAVVVGSTFVVPDARVVEVSWFFQGQFFLPHAVFPFQDSLFSRGSFFLQWQFFLSGAVSSFAFVTRDTFSADMVFYLILYIYV